MRLSDQKEEGIPAGLKSFSKSLNFSTWGKSELSQETMSRNAIQKEMQIND
jgi:hypothetical protein